jgi:hypothetical protein
MGQPGGQVRLPAPERDEFDAGVERRDRGDEVPDVAPDTTGG